MIPLLRSLADHGGLLLAGVTVLLAGGVLAMRLQRSPIHRQRLAELTVGSTLLWLVLACVPLPRLIDRTSAASPPPLLLPPPRPAAPAPRSVIPPTEPSESIHLAAHPPTAQALTPHVQAARTVTPPPVVAASPATGPGVGVVIAACYAGGSLACAVWLTIGGVLLHRLVRRASAAPAWLRELFDSLDASAPATRLLVSRRCRRPVSCGVLRPTVLLPAVAAAPDNASQLRQVLLHELGHVRQRDAWGNALFNLALPLLYFHPLYWLVRRDAHVARELIADDWAAARSNKASYVAELVALARSAVARGGPAGPWGSISLFHSPSHFYRRMQMLLQRTDPLATSCSRAWRLGAAAAFGLGLLLAAGAWGVRPVRAQDATRPPAADEPPAADPTVPATDEYIAQLERERQQLAREVAAYRQRLQDLRSGRAPQLGIDDIARMDPSVASKVERRDALKADLARLSLTLGPRHKTIVELKRGLLGVDQEIEQAAGDFRKKWVVNNHLGASPEQLEEFIRVAQKAAQDLGDRLEVLYARSGAGDSKLDAIIARKLDEAKAAPDEVSDEQYVRRLYLDLTGVPPSPEDVAKFKADTSPDKRARLALDLRRRQAPDAGAVDPLARPAGPRVASSADAGNRIDLVALAVSYVDAAGAARAARYQLEIMAKLHQNKNATELELAMKKSDFDVAERKVRLLRGMIEIARDAAKSELQFAEESADRDASYLRHRAEAQHRLRMLELILKSEP